MNPKQQDPKKDDPQPDRPADPTPDQPFARLTPEAERAIDGAEGRELRDAEAAGKARGT